jgi:monoamine oxidase
MQAVRQFCMIKGDGAMRPSSFFASRRLSEVGAIGSEGFTLPVPDADVHDFMTAVTMLDQLAKEVPADAPWEAPRAAEWDNQTMASWTDANVKTNGVRFALRIEVGGYFSVEPSDLYLPHLPFYIAARNSSWLEIPIMGIVEFDSAGKMTLMRDYFDSRLAL